ncbi:MAG: lipid II flippase MurJ, partial [Planctomycetes bacterium]|nr:lipid II flippase MurJ [Planctomycetota bacterium]
MSRHHRFVGSAKLLSLLTMASRLLGVVREMAYGYCFGASPLLSHFRIAFQVPNLARRLFGEGALTSSFIPVFTKCRQTEGDDASKRLAGGVLTLVVVILTAGTVLAEIGLLIAESLRPHPAVRLTMILM